MLENSLLDHVKLAINPKFHDWVLFENGTYIIFDNAETFSDLRKKAINKMKELGPLHEGGSASDFSVTPLSESEGWVCFRMGIWNLYLCEPNRA